MYKLKALGSARKNAANTPAASARRDEELQSRRKALCTIMAITGSLWLPLTFSTSSSAIAAGETGPKKSTQASVRYQSKPNAKQNCGNCNNFIAASNSCKLVEGNISAEGWCSIWSKKN
jgi:hypothetical protein